MGLLIFCLIILAISVLIVIRLGQKEDGKESEKDMLPPGAGTAAYTAVVLTKYLNKD